MLLVRLLRNLFTDRGKGRIRVQALQEIVRATLDTHVVPGLHGMLTDFSCNTWRSPAAFTPSIIKFSVAKNGSIPLPAAP